MEPVWRPVCEEKRSRGLLFRPVGLARRVEPVTVRCRVDWPAGAAPAICSVLAATAFALPFRLYESKPNTMAVGKYALVAASAMAGRGPAVDWRVRAAVCSLGMCDLRRDSPSSPSYGLDYGPYSTRPGRH